VKDKLWFFANYDIQRRRVHVPDYPYDGDDISPAYTEFFPFIKFTYQPDQNNKFMFSYLYYDQITDHYDASYYRNVETTQTMSSPTHMINTNWTHFFGNNTYANLKFAFIDYEMHLDAKQPGIEYRQYSTYNYEGSHWINSKNKKKNRSQFNLDVTTFIDDFGGPHILTAGAEIRCARIRTIVDTYSDSTNGSGYAILYPEYYGEPGYYYGVNYHGGLNRKEKVSNFSLYVKDAWTVTGDLTLNLGLRYDDQAILWPKQNQNEKPFEISGMTIDRRINKSITATDWNTISPRIGLIYDVFSDGTILFKTSWGRYVQPAYTGLVQQAHPNGWVATGVMLDHTTGEPVLNSEWPYWTPGNIQVGYPGYDLEAPYMDEFTFGLEKEMCRDWSLGLRYIKKWDRNLIHIVDANALNIDALMDDGELIWTDFEKVLVIDPYDNSTVVFYNDLNPYRSSDEYLVNPPGAERDYDGIELILNKRYSKGWALNASYVYASSRGLISTYDSYESLSHSDLYHNPNAHTNITGHLEPERRHQIKISGIVKGPWGINISGYFRHLTGKRYTRQITSSYIDTTVTFKQGDVTINAEKRGASSYPSYTMIDIRIEKAFKVKNVDLKIFADIFNIFNSNSATKIFTDSSNPQFNFEEALDIIDPRVVRLGAKIEF
jgi:outer membrane receptor protein involved in Fe transport